VRLFALSTLSPTRLTWSFTLLARAPAVFGALPPSQKRSGLVKRARQLPELCGRRYSYQGLRRHYCRTSRFKIRVPPNAVSPSRRGGVASSTRHGCIHCLKPAANNPSRPGTS
jgi:hypothetical protein